LKEHVQNIFTIKMFANIVGGTRPVSNKHSVKMG
jgi:hypothetical protein